MQGKFLKVTLLSVAIALSVAPMQAEAKMDEHAVVKKQKYTQSMVNLKNDLRRLWIEHALWTRNYIISDIAGLEDQEKTLNRLLKNQQDIGNAFKPYYGEAAGNQLAELLKEHILLAGKVLDAAKTSNKADFEKYNKEWYRNADDLAVFLSKANPYWSEKALKDILYKHLDMITIDVTARLKKDWDADIAEFDKGVDHLIMLADFLSEGVIQQFPKQFK
ncbi:hypothetical protein GCM10008018_59930 [Paenibacillus marchantiophytorum]|uniref:Glycosyltransferase n=1 Tax=Paenibacillus marchantiophytorum TaxID=1619310 RepID=A0ABQ1FBK6_9BACL|nr:glycosyltransferase [Paenibacillus marchantiophytorum]GGA06003.1 hypothetical protein GCM10008018_59930 [Paenibacillus marchantiophytorum]